jgi:hypothetical protein
MLSSDAATRGEKDAFEYSMTYLNPFSDRVPQAEEI